MWGKIFEVIRALRNKEYPLWKMFSMDELILE